MADTKTTICEQSTCDKQVYARSLCRAHYVRMMRANGERVQIRGLHSVCSVDACGGKHECRGFCNRHYIQFRTYGRILSDAEVRSHYNAPNFFKKGHTPWQKLLPGYVSTGWVGRTKFSRNIRPLVMERDNHTCAMCLSTGVPLQVDHIKSWAEFPELRFDIDNCRTLCISCHYFVTFGKEMPEGIVWGRNLVGGKV